MDYQSMMQGLYNQILLNNPLFDISKYPITQRLSVFNQNPRIVKSNIKYRMMSDNPFFIKVWEHNDLLTFGIYKGMSIEDVSTNFPKYIIYCALELDSFAVNPYFFLSNSSYKNLSQFNLAAEHNYIKLNFLGEWEYNEEYCQAKHDDEINQDWQCEYWDEQLLSSANDEICAINHDSDGFFEWCFQNN